jgi:hypothetical protein
MNQTMIIFVKIHGTQNFIRNPHIFYSYQFKYY